MDERRAAIERAHQLAGSFLDGLDARPVWPRADITEMLERLGGDLPDNGLPAVQVVEELAAAADPGLVGSAGPRFFGFVVGGGLPAALGADWLTSAWDQNAGLTSMAPAAAAAEVVAGRWMVDLMGLPEGSAVGFVTGGMMANFTCLSAARNAVLTQQGWDVSARGLFAAPPVSVVVGRSRHDTVDRAVRYLGLGQQAVVEVDTDAGGRILTDAFEATLDAITGPMVVCLQAGEVHTGAFDPIADLVTVARRRSCWIHVDGAFGLWAAASPRRRHLTSGMEEADSWATDAHKTLNVPYDSGLAIVRDPAALAAGFGVEADYLIGDVGDPLQRVPELSRRARGFAVYAALRSLGREGVAGLVDRLCDRAGQMAEGLARLDGAAIVNDVDFTQVMVSFGDDERTTEVGRRLLAEGTAVFTPAVWRGRAVQRCSLSGWSTTEQDVAATVDAVRRVLAGL